MVTNAEYARNVFYLKNILLGLSIYRWVLGIFILGATLYLAYSSYLDSSITYYGNIIFIVLSVLLFIVVYRAVIAIQNIILNIALCRLYLKRMAIKDNDCVAKLRKEVNRYIKLHRFICRSKGLDINEIMNTVCCSKTNEIVSQSV